MNSTFSRSVIGFLVLTAALVGMSKTALWSIAAYLPDTSGLNLAIVLVTLVAVTGVYFTTLKQPIYSWIEEPGSNLGLRFVRSVIGFLTLTALLAILALTGLSSIEMYAGNYLWVNVVVVLVTLIAEVIVYVSTLHPPVSDWIKGPGKPKASD